MPQNDPDFDAIVRTIVAEEMRTALEPLRAAIERIASHLTAAGNAAQGALDTLPKASAPVGMEAPVPVPRKASSPRRSPPAPTVGLREGEKVRYTEGDVDHEAVIQAIEPESGSLLLVGADGTEVIRTVEEVRSAAATPAETPRKRKKKEAPADPAAQLAGSLPSPGDDVVYNVDELRFDGIVLEVDPDNAIALVERTLDGRTAWHPLASLKCV